MAINEAVGMLCADIAGTILHTNNDDYGPEVKPVDSNGRGLHDDVARLLDVIRKNDVIVTLVTGMRPASYKEINEKIPHDNGISEHGGVIINKSAGYDWTWFERISKGVTSVHQYKEHVRAKGIKVDDRDRQTSFRLIPNPDPDNTVTLDDILEKLASGSPPSLGNSAKYVVMTSPVTNRRYHLAIPANVNAFLHIPYPPEFSCVEFIPSQSGKENGIEYVAAKYNFGWDRIAAFGDDTNDLGMVIKARFGFTFADTRSNDLIKAVDSKAEDGYITDKSNHAGTIDVLNYFIERVIPELKG